MPDPHPDPGTSAGIDPAVPETPVARGESTADVLARADRWVADGRLPDALAEYRALAVRLEDELASLRAVSQDRRAEASGTIAPASLQAVGSSAPDDALTGLPGRSGFADAVAQLVRRHPDAPPTLLVVDIDHFRRINDARSRAVGDAVLRELAQLLRAQSRPQDLLARLGGGQFVVAFGSAVSLTRAMLVAERLRAAVERHGWPSIDVGLGVTASVGVAACTAGEPLEGALQRAAAALAECQRNGRNQVRCSS